MRDRSHGKERVEVVDADDSVFDRRSRPASAESRLPTRGRRRVAKWSVVGIIAIVVAMALVTDLSGSDRNGAPASTTQSPQRTGAASVTSESLSPTMGSLIGFSDGRCADDRLPFRPGYLPNGWDIAGGVWNGVDPANGSAGIIELHHGAQLPSGEGPTAAITVLGRPATIGAISDGYAVWLVLGAANDPCHHWALVAHPNTTRDTLQRIAERLTAFDPGVQTLDCQTMSAYHAALPNDHSVVLDVVALATGRTLQTGRQDLPGGASVLFAKDGLLVKTGSAFDLTVAPEWEGVLGFSWQNGGPIVSAVHVPACPGATPWLDNTGGFYAARTGCMAVIVHSHATQQQRVEIGIGAPCPGQAPPDQPSDT